MPSIFDERARETLLKRLDALTPDARRGWGRLTPAGAMAHLCDAMLMGLGDLPVAPTRPGRHKFQRFPLKHLVLYVLPFPKGVRTAPELLTSQPGDFERDRDRLRSLVARQVAGPRDGLGPTHPFFGPLTRREWAVLTLRHFDHHLRQFGV